MYYYNSITKKYHISMRKAEDAADSFSYNIERVWVHTCSLDHKNALTNYLSRGMKIYNIETANIKSA